MSKVNNDFSSPFTDEELKSLNVSEENIQTIRSADAIAESMALLPEDIEEVLNKLDKYFPNDNKNMEKTFETLSKLGDKDPELLKQLFVLVFVLGEAREAKPASVEKVSLNDIEDVKLDEQSNEEQAAFKKFLDAFMKLTPKEKQALADKINKK